MLTMLERRFRDACFWRERSNDGTSERSRSPAMGGRGGEALALEIELDASRVARGIQKDSGSDRKIASRFHADSGIARSFRGCSLAGHKGRSATS